MNATLRTRNLGRRRALIPLALVVIALADHRDPWLRFVEPPARRLRWVCRLLRRIRTPISPDGRLLYAAPALTPSHGCFVYEVSP